MKVKIRNYRVIGSADIDLAPIALVAAPNACGKTSIAQALASTVLGTAVIIEDMKAGDSGQLIRAGSDRAQILVESETGSAQIKIPHGKYESKGERPPRASRYALGLQSLVTDDARERAKVLMEYLKAVPTKDDLSAALPRLGKPTPPDAEKSEPSYIDVLWQNVEKYGWDGQHARSKEVGAKFKGQWETLSGENYGSQKAQSWTPEGWSGELAAKSIAALEQDITDARNYLETAIASGAVSDEERGRLEALAARAEELVTQVAQQRDEIASTDKLIGETAKKITDLRQAKSAGSERAQIEKLAAELSALEAKAEKHIKDITAALTAVSEAEKALAALPKPEAAQAEPTRSAQLIKPCPHCGKKVCINGSALSIPSEPGPALDKAVATKAEQTRKDRTTAIATAELNVKAKRDSYDALNRAGAVLDSQIVNAKAAKAKLAKMPASTVVSDEEISKLESDITDIRTQRDEMQRNLGTLEQSLKDAQSAAATLTELPAGTVTEAEIDRQREVVRLAEQKLDVFRRKTEADRLADKIQMNAEIIAALDPKGVRQAKLAESLGSFNASLKTICEAASWPIVEVDEDLRTSIGGWRFSLASASMQWRIRAALQIAMGEIDHSDVLIFDGADLLDGPGRSGLMRLLSTMGKTALVTMTENIKRVPNLSDLGIGQTYWIENGTVRPLAEIRQATAA